MPNSEMKDEILYMDIGKNLGHSGSHSNLHIKGFEMVKNGVSLGSNRSSGFYACGSPRFIEKETDYEAISQPS